MLIESNIPSIVGMSIHLYVLGWFGVHDSWA